LDVDAGEITVDRRAVHNIGPRRTAIGGIARTFQDIRLFTNLTVRQNIEVAFTTAPPPRLCFACVLLPLLVFGELS